MRTIKTLIVFTLISLSFNANAQLTQYDIGSAGNELALKVKYLSSDGSTIIAGYSYDIISGPASNCQAILMKVTSVGTIAWQKTFGVAGKNNLIQDMIITADGNIVVVGTMGRGLAIDDGNGAAILKFNAATGSIMWQTCLRDSATTSGGELFFGVTELTDGTGRLVAVGAHDFTGPGSGSMICVFSSTGSFIYDEVDDIFSGDVYQGITTSADGASVYLCGEFVGTSFKDGRVISYTPGTSSGTINWSDNIDFSALGTMSNNSFIDIYLSDSTLVVLTKNLGGYSATEGWANAIVTMNAADGSDIKIKTIQNSDASYGNNSAIFPISADHIFMVQAPDSVYVDATTVIAGASTDGVITEITSLSSGTANTPVRFTSSAGGQHTLLDMDMQGSTLYLAGTTNISGGFGSNDIYLVKSSTSLSSLNHTCDTTHDTVSITSDTYTVPTPSVSISSFIPAYFTVDTSSTSLSILAICGDIPMTCNEVNLPDTLFACNGSKVPLPATVTGIDSIIKIHWSPATGLSDTAAMDPVLTVSAPGWYYLFVESLIPNLVKNGNFSAGNTGFSSTYTYVTSADAPGDYEIGPDPGVFNPGWPDFGDHTTGTGNMLVVDGKTTTPTTTFWCESVSVVPNTDYVFSVWSALISSPDPTVELTINGVNTGTFSPTSTVGEWVQYQITWNSGTDTTADICFKDLSTIYVGNDFAIDDISFQQICKTTDSIYVAVTSIDSTFGSQQVAACISAAPVTLTVPAGYTAYHWNTGSTTPSIHVGSSGFYLSSATIACQLFLDSFFVTINPLPVFDLGTDTVFCKGGTLTLGTSEHFIGYLWSTGVTSATLTVPYPGTYWVTVTDSNGCKSTDSIHVITDTIHAFFSVSPNPACEGGVVSFIDSSMAVTPAYLWGFGDGNTSASNAPSHTYQYAGTYTAFEVITDYVPCHDTAYRNIYVDSQSNVTLTLSDTVLCSGNYLTLTGTYNAQGNTGITWLMGNGDSIKNINPLTYAYSRPGNYTITATALYDVCNDVNTTRSLSVLSTPIIDLGNDTGICKGSSIIYLVDKINAGNDQASWLWNTGQTTPGIDIVEPGQYYVTVAIDGCSSSDSVWIRNDCYLDIPNAFTPNDDGVNDYFLPRQYLSSGLTTFQMSIYDRWGELLFKTGSTDGSGWDGKFNGIPQPQGVYVYMIDATFKDGEKEHHQGNVTLLR